MNNFSTFVKKINPHNSNGNMTKLKLTLLVVCVFFLSAITRGQDTLVMINGKQKTNIEFMKIQDDYIYYQKWQGENAKTKLIAKEQVYAIYTKEGHQIITYIQDSIGFVLDEKRMFDYIQGMDNAWSTFHNPYVFGISFLLSAGAGIYPGVPFGLIVPVVIPGIVAVTHPKVFKTKHIPANRQSDYYYVLGYQDIARSKKVRSSVFGGLSGYTVGAVLNISGVLW